jgi:hypothetical protein
MLVCRGKLFLKRVGILTVFIFLFALISKRPWLKNKACVQNIEKKFLPKKPKPFNLVKYKAEFAAINEKYCKVFTLNSPECLNQLKQFDERMKNEFPASTNSTVNMHRLFCEYKPDGETLETFLHHTFFNFDHNDQKNRRMMKLNILSFLATQNLMCTKLIVWLLKEFSKEVIADLNKMFSVYVGNKTLELRVFDLNEICSFKRVNNESMFSSFVNHSVCTAKEDLHSHLMRNVVAFSDFVRFVVLDVFGGIYVDGDVVFLKDTRILWNENFAYRFYFLSNYFTIN